MKEIRCTNPSVIRQAFKKLSNYVRMRNARKVIQILWIKLEEDLILSFPTLTRETERGAQPKWYNREIKNLQPMELGIILDEARLSSGN